MHGIGYEETADITSIRILIQLAVQYSLTIHQMDGKTAFLYAPIDHKIFMEQTKGVEELSEDVTKLVYKLKKSLYGLKQSGRNWITVLHEYLLSDGFVRSAIDHCVYQKQVGDDVMVLAV